MAESPPNLPGVVSGITQQNFDALNRRLYALEAPEDWVSPTLVNSWARREVEGYAGPAYRKCIDDRVTIKGLVEHTGSLSANSVIFTLPEGFRPTGGHLLFPMLVNTGSVTVCRIQITSAGEVVYIPNTTAAVSSMPLNLSFYAE